jgi:uncharacterized protein
VLAGIAIAGLQIGHTAFPGDRPVAHVGRALCSLFGVVLLFVGSRRLLRRDGLAVGLLPLGCDWSHARAFLIGAGIASVHILMLMATIYAIAPFELGRGPLGAGAVALAGVGYLTGNFVEELLFRGYLLVALARWLGTARALWVLAVPFGLFHFQGLDGPTLGMMMLTTGAGHFIFAYAWLATRSLWAAVAAHAFGNTLLHTVVGAGAPAALSVHYVRPLSGTGAFLAFLGTSVLLAILLSRLPATRRGAAWSQSASS